jgi:carbamoyl-phosphate synthase large subunit
MFQNLNILLSSVGRRVEIVEYFLKALNKRGKVYTADADKTAPALYIADGGFILPRVESASYLQNLIDLCTQKEIDLIISLIDPEIELLAANQELLRKRAKTKVLVSRKETVDICSDKLLTARLFRDLNIPYVETGLLSEYSWEGAMVIAKPRKGSASAGIHYCENQEQLEALKDKKDLIVQPILSGTEVTIDILCNLNGQMLSAVPRKRLKLRAGEVERGITIELDFILSYLEIIVKQLKPIGPVNIQCFIIDKRPVFTEINARFGGGYPLSYHAGVDFPKMIIKMLNGIEIKSVIGEYKRDLLLLRYDRAVIIDKKDLVH